MTVQRFLQFGGLFADGGLRCPADFQRFRGLLTQLFRLAHAAVALIQRRLNELQTVLRLSPSFSSVRAVSRLTSIRF